MRRLFKAYIVSICFRSSPFARDGIHPVLPAILSSQPTFRALLLLLPGNPRAGNRFHARPETVHGPARISLCAVLLRVLAAWWHRYVLCRAGRNRLARHVYLVSCCATL